MDYLTLAESLKNEGNYKQAIEEYKKALSSATELRNKANINQKITIAKSYYNAFKSASIGEAFFPVVNPDRTRGLVLTSNVSLTKNNKLSAGLQERWNKVKEIAINFIDNYLFEEIKTVMILDWGKEKFNFSIKQIPNSNLDLNDIVDGNSIELVMFVSFVSFILDLNVGNTLAFSGGVKEDFSVYYIIDEDIKIKTKAIKKERPAIKKMIIPSMNNKKDALHLKVSKLQDIIENVFPTFKKSLLNKQNVLGERRISLQKLKVKFEKKQIDYADFNLGKRGNIDEEEGVKVYSFLDRSVNEFKNSPNGLIISGLTISYSAPMFVLPLYNHTPKFLALRYTQSSDLPSNTGAAYIILSKDPVNYPIGKRILFKLPSCYSS